MPNDSHMAFTVSCDMNKGAGHPYVAVMLCLLLGHMTSHMINVSCSPYIAVICYAYY